MQRYDSTESIHRAMLLECNVNPSLVSQQINRAYISSHLILCSKTIR